MVKQNQSSFNPYSIGFYSLILLFIGVAVVAVVVSILILLDSLLLSYDQLEGIITTVVFQSLFYWILFFYNAEEKRFGRKYKFQSLFYWILFFYKEVIPKHTEIDYLFQSLFYWILFSYKLMKET